VGTAGGGSLRGVTRSIEDKMVSYQMDLRPIYINADLSRLHRNSERPALYNGWICVPDAFLPLKGTAHRAIKDAEAVKPSHINAFTDSELWRLQGLPVDNLPSAIPEAEFNVPSARAHLSGNDARRNLTDAQETAQWIAGPCFTEKMLASLLGPLVV